VVPAYGVNLSPAWMLHHLVHYLRWAFDLRDPIPDRVASAEGALSLAELLVAGALVAAVAASARRWRRAEAVGGMWFASLLALVLPLSSHSYLYYLYVPWAGACWCIASMGTRLRERWPGRGTSAAAGLGVGDLHRARAAEPPLSRADAREWPAVDRTVRESLLVRTACQGVRQAGLTAPDSICFVNPFPRVHQVLSGDAGGASRVSSYVPLAGALRDGETLRLFFPELRLLGFADRIPEEWEQASVFFYDNDGTLLHLGRRAEAHRRLGGMLVEAERWVPAEASFRRALALGDTTADTAYGFLFAIASQGRSEDATRLARAFVFHWPADGRTPFLMQGLASESR
jgi:hypothetical protein